MAHKHAKRAEGKVLNDQIKGIKVAMLTTIDQANNILRSRPMVTQETEFDGDLWFFTHVSSPMVAEAENRQVNISYVSPGDNRYTSVSGVAQLVRDRKKIEETWKPAHNAWFAGGKNDPDLVLLKVTVTSAEYWDGPSNKMVQIFEAAQAFVTGKPGMGTSEKLQFT